MRYPLEGGNAAPSAVLTVEDGVGQPSMVRSQRVRALRLVALGQVESATLIIAPVEDGILDAEQPVIPGHPASGLVYAARNISYAGGC